MTELIAKDRHHLAAAQGWLSLGNAHEAESELDKMQRTAQSHVEVLHARWAIQTLTGQHKKALRIARKMVRLWTDDSSGPIELAATLYALGRTKEAVLVLKALIQRFAQSDVTGQVSLARRMLERILQS